MKPPSAIAGAGDPLFEVWLPGHPPGANEITRMNRYKLGSERATWKDMAWKACREKRLPSAGYLGTADQPVILHFTCDYRTDRKRDVDNLIASFKPIIDGIVAAKVLPDDDARVIAGILVDVRVDKVRPSGITISIFHKEYPLT